MPPRKWLMVGDSYPSSEFIPTSTHEHYQASVLPSWQYYLSWTHPQNQYLKGWFNSGCCCVVTNIRKNCKVQAESKKYMTSLFFGRTCVVTYLLQKKKRLADTSGFLSLLEILLKQHEG